MTILSRQLFISSALVFSASFLNVLFIQNANAESVIDDIQNKGQQCRSWVQAGDLRRDQVSNCLGACESYGYSLKKHPEILSEAGIQGCNNSYSMAKNKMHGTGKPASSITQAPDTIESIIEDLKKASNEWKIEAEKATTPTAKKQAEACYSTCDIAGKRIASKATSIHRAQGYWSQCAECKTDSTTINTKLNQNKKTLASSSPQNTKSTTSSIPDVEGVYLQAMQGRLRVRAEGRDDWNTICVEFARIKDRSSDYARKLKGHDHVRLIGITFNPDEPSGPRGTCSAERIVILGPSQ